MKITVNREISQGGATMGKLYIDGAYVCHTLEDEVREINGQAVSEWKIKGQTAIPTGLYRVTLEQSGKFGPDTLTINDVPGFQFIRIHAGNTADDTEGCILVGMQATDFSLVGGTSRPALALIKESVKNAIAKGDDVWIDIQPYTMLS